MPEILRETTVWNCGFEVANHTYLIGDSGRIIAYAVGGSNEVRTIKSKMKIDKRGRTFKKENHPGLLKILKNEKPDADVRKFKVKSKEKEYIVTLRNNNFACTCMGFTYRGTCKHTKAVAEKLQSA